jgi:hypothetical protein
MAGQINQDTPRNQTLTVKRDERLYGLGSKNYRLYASNSAANPLIEVESTWDFQAFTSYPDKNAVIENLIIDGQNYPDIVGIKLDDVVRCDIRNVTIKNCAVGIHFHDSSGCWTECNRLQHIRMENVKTGILFTTDGPYINPDTGQPVEGYPGDSAGHTIIDDVGISLANIASAVGIQIGNSTNISATHIKPYGAFIKANIWLGSAGGTGLKILNGELKNGLINLSVQGPSNGIGVDIDNQTSYRSIYHNQLSTFNANDNVINPGFLLSTGGLSNPVFPAIDPNNPNCDIKVKSF